MEAHTFIGQIKLYTIECCECGTLFAMTETLRNEYKRSRGYFTCPNGHSQAYSKTKEEDLQAIIKKKDAELAKKDEEIRIANAYLHGAQKSVNSLKGIVTRYKNKINKEL